MSVVIFDVDGVFLSEERCFDVSALSVHELLFNPRYLNLTQEKFKTSYTDEEIAEIRSKIFLDDEILSRYKELGLNSNWDMLYITFSVIYINLLKDSGINISNVDLNDLYSVGEMLGDVEPDYGKVLEFLDGDEYTKETIYEGLVNYATSLKFLNEKDDFRTNSTLWLLGQHVYQEWYLGSERMKDSELPIEGDKEGFLHQEEWLAPVDELEAMLQNLLDQDLTIGIATGRSREETLIPFEAAGLLKYFNDERISTASEVKEAEAVEGVERQLSKPHPYSYLWTLYAQDENHFEEAVKGENNSDEKVYVVGDSVADFFCAEKMEVEFIGTLTGLTGDDIIPTFTGLGVERDNLVPDVLAVEEMVK
ncbi:HAD family hydrolase [Lacicoccus alkaliphilus]|uniref:HAD-hyrolase-like n=1 Tax=Lacicoccus alkaliphilus DSM 16010 TaxID=1123231 RepID=A0A1M7E974_9BACL|nr:HAD hydrolase-like protein [Salinicoccus alkaliphilus]SHL88314.1 HAD-hyrolase-like [Salinicoccus alkaliphilus DSM 16010]